MLEAIRYVDLVIPESCWEQKRSDVETYPRGRGLHGERLGGRRAF